MLDTIVTYPYTHTHIPMHMHSGVNPYVTEEGSVGSYTIHVTPKGDQVGEGGREWQAERVDG